MPVVLAVGRHFCHYYQCYFILARWQVCSDELIKGPSKNGNLKFQVTEVRGDKIELRSKQ